MKLSRREFSAILGGTAAATVLTGRPVKAADTKLTVRLDWQPSGYQAPIYLAVVKGWYQKAGLDVKIDQGNGSATTVNLVGAGQYDIGMATLSTMAPARRQGMPLISIAGFFRKGDLALLVPVDSSIHAPKDCKGKRLVYTSGSMEAPFLDMWFAAGGLKRSDADLLQVDASAKLPTYLLPTSDGVFTSTAFSVPVVNAKKPTRPVLFADFKMNMPGFGLMGNLSSLKSKGDAIKKFASITAGAWTYVVDGHHETEAADALIKSRPNDRLEDKKDVILGQLKASLPFLYSDASKNLPIGVQAEADWADAIKMLEQAHAIAPGSKAADYFTNDYLDVNLIKSTAAST